MVISVFIAIFANGNLKKPHCRMITNPAHTHHTEETLTHHGVKPTSVRLLVWQACERQTKTFSLADLEEQLPHMDRSSIFRALRLFSDHHLLHEVNDGSGHQKYCVCRCHDEQHSGHVHFTCTCCGRTYCLTELTIPHIPLPEGFRMQESEFVVKGICPQCGNKQ